MWGRGIGGETLREYWSVMTVKCGKRVGKRVKMLLLNLESRLEWLVWDDVALILTFATIPVCIYLGGGGGI